MKNFLKTKSFFITIIFTFFAASFSFAQNSLFSKSSIPHVNNALPFSKGISIPTWFEPYEQCQSGITYFGKHDFVNIRNMGADIIRLPIHFETFSSGYPDYRISSLIFEVLDEVVKWAEELKVYVIFDCHDDGMSPTTESSEKILSKIWTQIATRYRSASKYILYEIKSEPWGIDDAVWGEIQGRIIKVIRQHDTNHYVIVGGANYNSIQSMLKLPEYDDFKLIYSFHNSDPLLFTHQGEYSVNLSNMKNIPYPYNASEMPPLTADMSEYERYLYNNYRADSDVNLITGQLDRVVAFANARRGYVMCTSFGAYNRQVQPRHKAAWAKMMTSSMSERGIPYINWAFSGDYGLFKIFGTEFPRDLNQQVVTALGFDVPSYKVSTWVEDAKKSGNYTIYNGRFSPKISVSMTLPNNGVGADLFKYEPETGDRYIYLPFMMPYSVIRLAYSKPCDFTQLYARQAKFEFYAKTDASQANLQVWFENRGRNGPKWRATAFISSNQLKGDGQWHKISVPFTSFSDNGAYDEVNKIWMDGQGKFSWNDINLIQIQNTDKRLDHELMIKDIKIVVD